MRPSVNTSINKPKRLIFSLVTIFLLTLGVSSALADVQDYTIGNGNAALNGYTGPYATLSITTPTLNSSTATATFTSLLNGGYLYLMGDGGTADLNVNGTYSLGTVNESNSIAGFTPSFDANVPGQVDGFGKFNLSLNNNDGFTDAATTISFTLTKDSGTWADAASVLTANKDGYLAAVHAFACLDPCNTAEGAAVTGFAANGAVPEPRLLSVLALGMAGLLFQARRKLSAKGTSANN